MLTHTYTQRVNRNWVKWMLWRALLKAYHCTKHTCNRVSTRGPGREYLSKDGGT